MFLFFFFQAEDGIRDIGVTGVQTCALPISDDLVLFADGTEGLQQNLDTLIEDFARVGLVLNAAKHASLVITSHCKKWVCNTRSTLKVNNITNMPAMSINDSYITNIQVLC